MNRLLTLPMCWPAARTLVGVMTARRAAGGLVWGAVLWAALAPTVSAQSQAAAETAAAIAQEALTVGDVQQGALLFHSSQLGCARCHSIGEPNSPRLGPDLAIYPPDQRPSDVELVEAITQPSKRIRPGFESTVLLTSDGRTLNGRLIERRADRVILQDAMSQRLEIASEDIEHLQTADVSAMPTGLTEQLGSRQQLLNLVRFLMEVRNGGPEQASQWRTAFTASVTAIPSYESQIDHAALVRDASADVVKQGAAIYRRVCANCHGTLTEVGSLPTSLRFAEGTFKNGSDPYSMYRTLTYGFGMMTPQHWMVPKQKYAVIHYIREHYLRERNRSQWTEINTAYLANLPKGNTLGPEPSTIEPWNAMDYGPALSHTYEVSKQPLNIAYKGIAIRLDSGPGGVAQGSHWTVFDTDTLRWAAAWQADDSQDRFMDWRGIQFNGQHNIHPSLVGRLTFTNANGPGWANPADQSFDDSARVQGRDGRRYGPLPRTWGKYLGQYRYGEAVVMAYRVGNTVIHELPGLLNSAAGQSEPIVTRTLWVGPRETDLWLKVADLSPGQNVLRCGFKTSLDALAWDQRDDQLLLRLKAGEAFQFVLGITSDQASPDADQSLVQLDLELTGQSLPTADHPWKKGNATTWGTTLQTVATTLGEADDPFQIDYLHAPVANPWAAQMRFTGLDFLADGRLVVCTWDGDVWIVTNSAGTPPASAPANGSVAETVGSQRSALPAITTETESSTTATTPRVTAIANATSNANASSAAPVTLTWKRIASGLFQPLGLKLVDDQIYVTCRDQLVRLHDLNGDSEIDFYECFNNDHQVTEHFHEFAMGLQRDAQGNFYYAKSARHALQAIVPHHGTLLKVSPDGLTTEIVANGFRAANGVCLNPDGTFYVTDQEGHWNPKNRINWVQPSASSEPRFYGNLFGYTSVTDRSDDAMEPPLCWITNAFDRSPGELLWVQSDRWSTLNNRLLNLSYGMGRVYLVLQEKKGERLQGGMVPLPIPDFPTGVMRGRFHPHDQQLYLCGMYAWAGSAQQPGGLYRLRSTGQPIDLPVELHCSRGRIELRFAADLDPASITKDSLQVRTWALKRTANYGSKHYDEAELTVADVSLESDRRTLRVQIPELQPTWCMEIKYRVRNAQGKLVEGTLHNTIHTLDD